MPLVKVWWADHILFPLFKNPIITPSLFFLQALFKVRLDQEGYFLYQVLIVLKPKPGRSILCSIFCCSNANNWWIFWMPESCQAVVIVVSSGSSLLLLLLFWLLLLYLAHCLVQTTGGSSGAQIPPLFHNWHVSDLVSPIWKPGSHL